MAQQKGIQLGTMRFDVAWIWPCCVCGIGQWLQLQLDSQSGNVHMPICHWYGPKIKKIKKTEKQKQTQTHRYRELTGVCQTGGEGSQIGEGD